MINPKKLNKILIIILIIVIIFAIISLFIILHRKGVIGNPIDTNQPDTNLTDTIDPEGSGQDDHIVDPYQIVQKLLDINSADSIIRELSTIYIALEAGDTDSVGVVLSNIDSSSLEDDTAIFYYYDLYLYNSAIGNTDAAASVKEEIDAIDKNRNL